MDDMVIKMKGIIMIIDGMADRPLEELGGKTPLEAAKTPNMDHMAELGVNGIMDSYTTWYTCR